MRKFIVLAAAGVLMTGGDSHGVAAQVLSKAPRTTPTISKSEAKVAEARSIEAARARARLEERIAREEEMRRAEQRRIARDDDRWNRDRAIYRRNDRDYEDRANDRNNRNGPKFCQNGQGHPTKGRQWCEDKGYGNGDWSRATWEDVIFRTPQKSRQQLDRGTLIDVLGSVVVGRLDARSRTLGYRQPMSGHWMEIDGASVLRILSGNAPLAELVDRNGDRRTDVVLLRSH